MKNVSWLATLAIFGAAPQVVTFDSGTLDRPPAGWTVAMTHSGTPPKWEVRKDASAPSPPYVLAQLSTDASSDRAPIAVMESANLRDGEISVSLKPVGGKHEQAGGLIWRYRDAANYYVVRANALQENVAVFKVVNGQHVPIHPRGNPANIFGVRREIPGNQWSLLKVAFKGARFEIYMNHRRIIRGEDSTFASAGKVGLWTKADSVTYFDNFRIVQR